MCTSQPLSKVASYEWCRKYLEGLEEVNGTITLSTDLFLRLLRKAYSVISLLVVLMLMILMVSKILFIL